MDTAPEEQALLQFPPNHRDAPKQIIQHAFARARAAVNKALNTVEQLILATPLTWLAAVIISISLGHAVSSFVYAVFGLLRLAKKRIPFRVGTLPEEQSKDLSDIYDIVSAESENLAVD
jgi:hypothetical protein